MQSYKKSLPAKVNRKAVRGVSTALHWADQQTPFIHFQLWGSFCGAEKEISPLILSERNLGAGSL